MEKRLLVAFLVLIASIFLFNNYDKKANYEDITASQVRTLSPPNIPSQDYTPPKRKDLVCEIYGSRGSDYYCRDEGYKCGKLFASYEIDQDVHPSGFCENHLPHTNAVHCPNALQSAIANAANFCQFISSTKENRGCNIFKRLGYTMEPDCIEVRYPESDGVSVTSCFVSVYGTCTRPRP